MSKKQLSRKNAAGASGSRKSSLAIAITLALMSIVSASLLGQVNSRRKSKVPSGEVSVASLSAGSPSKEYIYAGGRLVATEEPNGSATPGTHTIGLYDSAHAAFFLRNSNNGGVADISFTFGPAGLGWIPIVGDWNGDGVDTIGLYDPAHAAFFLRNSNNGGVADLTFTFGPAGLGWIPIVGNWDGQ